ncbi:ribosome biogenesis factor YjgA [Alysiella crassa]|uniref:Dual-action ribosomal maturation protein DarP n=1 Tax=Alysiella crassa TaxID=153491 RepID=A0A376BJN9_9NEIS|nr:ribosome biogenesis factor YjgA [Alysiella crassa]UOP07788.1 DUF615 domain-containing protein [Alysiella crassa]SSY69967.1 x96 protein [Alysiella crassa]
MTSETEEWVSKTAKKKQMDELQDLGMALTKLSNETLKKIGLPEDLHQAIKDYKKITSNSATKRQAQYIGRLMRDIDPTPIREYLAKLSVDNQAHNAFLQRVEQMRTRLIEHDDALTQFIAQYPHADVSALRTLVRNARKEQAENKPPKNFRALYQELKNTMQTPDTPNDEIETET